MIDEELHCLRHSLGVGDDCSGREYRNYYAAQPDDAICLALVAKGDMAVGRLIPGGLQYFHVTTEGAAASARSQRRTAGAETDPFAASLQGVPPFRLRPFVPGIHRRRPETKSMTAKDLASILTSYRYHFADELELHAGLARALESAGVAFLREHRLEPYGRVDFLCDAIGLEVKIQEPRAAVLRQLKGYARHAAIASLILVTTRYQLRHMPAELCGKPLQVVFLGGAL